MKHITLNWPGVVALGLVLAAIVLIEVFGEPGSLVRLLEAGLAGLGAGGAVLPQILRRKAAGEAKPSRATMRPPPMPVLLLLLVLGALSIGCSGAAGAATAVGTATTVRDVSCHGARLACRVVDRICEATGGPDVGDFGGSGGSTPTDAPAAE